jgi:pimeloyl-ACP methyl ester carboxylesterase
VQVPTLVVRGGRSDVTSDHGVVEFLNVVPHARHATVDGAGHMVAGDRNDAFTAAVLAFLGQLTASPGVCP